MLPLVCITLLLLNPLKKFSNMIKQCIAGLVIACSVSSAYAQDRYVSDTLVINFRSGPSNEYKITKRLQSGDKLQLLETSDNKTWAKVRTSSGDEGWVLTQYLESKPVASIVVKTQLAEINSLKAQNVELETQLNTFKNNAGSLDSQVEMLTKKAVALEMGLTDVRRTSENAINLERENIELSQQNKELILTLDTVNAKLNRIQDDDFISYLIVGAGIFFAGLIVPALLGIRRPRKNLGGWQ